MSTTPVSLPLSDVVDVIVQVSPVAPAQPTFNIGLIIGSSAVIPSFGANSRVRTYTAATYSTQMLSDGFTNNSPEFIAAGLYFSQSPQPQTLKIGRQDLTAMETVQPHAANEGTNYQVGDVLTVVQVGGSGGTVKVTTVGGSGQVTAVQIVTKGTGYAVANGLTTTGGHGTGAEIDILTIGETPLDAVEACRSADVTWYGFTSLLPAGDLTPNTDIIAIAAWAQTAGPPVLYHYGTQDSNAPIGTGDIFSALKTLGYNRALGTYSTTQSGLFPNNIYIGAATLGVAMGSNTGLASSYFTMKFKKLVGIGYEPVTESVREIIEGNNGNLCLNFGNSYTFLEMGTMSNGQFMDEILFLDVLSSKIQFNIMNLLTQNAAIPQTDPGQTQLIHQVNLACQDMVTIGFLGGGTWEGVQVLNLLPGQAVPQGYRVQSPPYAQQSSSDRAARKSMPIYAAILESGAVHSVLVAVIVQR